MQIIINYYGSDNEFVPVENWKVQEQVCRFVHENMECGMVHYVSYIFMLCDIGIQ